MNTLRVVLFAIGVSLTGLASGQDSGPDRSTSNREIIKMGLYPPDAIMRHQQRLGISDDQRANISRAVKDFQSSVAELQWEMQNNQQLLRQSLSGYRIETREALSHAERVLGMESEFKLAHFKLLIAIKNELTTEQIDMLKAYIEQRRQRGER